MRKKAVWGTRNLAQKYALYSKEKIDFFIDNDKMQQNCYLFGKPILHPSQVKDWKELDLVIPEHYKEEIINQVNNLGVKEIHFDTYTFWNGFEEDFVRQDYNDCVRELENKSNVYQNKKIAIIQGKFYLSSRLIAQLHEQDYVFDSWIDDDFSMPYLMHMRFPLIFDIKNYIKEIDSQMESGLEIITGKLWRVVTQIEDLFQIERINACKQVMYIYNFFEKVILRTSPQAVLFPPRVTHVTQICEIICHEKNIPYASMHKGVLPGTSCIDVFGEVGMSVPAVWNKQFRRLPINSTEKLLALNVWKNQYSKRLNRKRQPENDVKSLLCSRLKPGRPTIFFAAQNDVESKMIPYTSETQKYNSPIFKSSIEAGVFLAKICKKNNWNLIYKSHPLYIRNDLLRELPDNTIYVEYGDINDIIDISDVVVTILSTTNYDAMMRYKPVVMLGYNWSRGQGCTYEAFEEELIEDTIKQAIEYGFTEEMQQAFLENIARMLKYYLYDDMTDRELRYGKPIPESFDGFFSLQRLLQDKTENEK